MLVFNRSNIWIYLNLCLQVPDHFLGLSGQAIRMVQVNLHFIQVALHLFLHPDGFITGFCFCIQGGLHGLYGTLVVTPSKVE